MIEVVLCQTGVGRHDPEVGRKLVDKGAIFTTVECFDRCETCERFVIARLNGATARFKDSAELIEAVELLGEP